MRSFIVTAACLFALAIAPGCKKKTESTPDASTGPAILEDAELAYRMQLPETWRVAEGTGGASGAGSWKLNEAQRTPANGRTYLVPPKLVITAQPTRATDTDAVVRQTMNDLRGLESKGARLGRSARSTRMIDGVDVGDIEIAYEVGKKKELPREVVQRSLVALRQLSDGSNVVWTLTVTYMSEDSEVVVPEIQHMMATLRFISRSAGGEARAR